MTTRFKIGLTFSGAVEERRSFVRDVALLLAEEFSREEILFDEFHEAEFAAIDPHLTIPQLYKDETELVVAFLCEDYANQPVPKAEWSAAMRLALEDATDRVLICEWEPVNLPIQYGRAIPVNDRSASEVAELAKQRLEQVRERKAKQLAAVQQEATKAGLSPAALPSSPKTLLLNQRLADLEQQAALLADEVGQNLSNELQRELRQLNQQSSAQVRQKLEAWLNKNGHQASAEVRLKAILYLAESLLFDLELRGEPGIDKLAKLSADAHQLISAETPEDTCAQLLCVDARIAHTKDGPASAVDSLAVCHHPRCIRLKLAYLYERGEAVEAAAIVNDEENDALWADVGCQILSAASKTAEARQLYEWALKSGDDISMRRCSLGYATGLFISANANDDGKIGPAFAPIEVAWLNEALNVIDNTFPPHAAPIDKSGMRVRASELGLKICRLLRDLPRQCEFAELLIEQAPISAQVGYAMLWGVIRAETALVTRIRAENPHSFEAHYVAAAVEASMMASSDELKEHLPRLWELVESDDQKEAVSGIVAQYAQRLGPIDGLDLLSDLESRMGEDYSDCALTRGWNSYNAGDLDEAKKLIKMQDSPLATSWQLLYAKVMQAGGDLDAAFNELVTVAKIIEHPAILWQVGCLGWELREWKTVAQHLERLHQLSPLDQGALTFLWQAQAKIGTDESLARAAISLRRLIELEPTDKALRFNLGIVLVQLGRQRDAIEAVGPICGDQPGSEDTSELARFASILKTQQLLVLNRPDEAFALAESCLIHFSNQVDFLHCYVNTAYRAKRDDAAADATSRIVALEQHLPEAEKSVQAVDFEHVLSRIRNQADFLKHVRKEVCHRKLPWSLSELHQGRSLLQEWIHRTGEIVCLPSPEVCGGMVTYASDGFAIGHNQQLEPFGRFDEVRAVVIDKTSLITMQLLGFLTEALTHFDRVFIHGSLLQELGQELQRIEPLQQSKVEACEKACLAADRNEIKVNSASSALVIKNFDPTSGVGLKHLIDRLHENGKLDNSSFKLITQYELDDSGPVPDWSKVVTVQLTDEAIKAIVTNGILGHLTESFTVTADADVIDGLRRERMHYAELAYLRESYQQLIDQLKEHPHVSFQKIQLLSPEEADSTSDDAMSATAEARESVDLAIEQNLPLVIDERLWQQSFHHETEKETPSGASWHVAELLWKQGLINDSRLAQICLQLIEKRFRFFVPDPKILLHFAIEHAGSCPGRPLGKIAQYAHESMADPGLGCALEPSAPPASLASALCLQWCQTIGEFIVELWQSEEVTSDVAMRFTNWAAWELLPTAPLNAPRHERISAATKARELVLVRILMRLTLDISARPSAAMMKCVERAFGFTRAEFCQVADMVATFQPDDALEFGSVDQGEKLMKELSRRTIRHATGYYRENADEDSQISIDHFSGGLLLKHRVFKPEAELDWAEITDSDTEAIQNRNHDLRREEHPGPIVFIAVPNKPLVNIVHPLELLSHTDHRIRCAAADFLKHLVNESGLTFPALQYQVQNQIDDLRNDDPARWFSAAMQLTIATDQDFLLALAAFRQSLTLPTSKFQDLQSRYWTRVLVPTTSPADSIRYEDFYPACNPTMLDDQLNQVREANNTAELITRYVERFRHIPLGLENSLGNLIRERGAAAEAFPILIDLCDLRQPLQSYQASQALLDLWDNLDEEQRRLVVTTACQCLQLFLQPEDCGLEGELWLVQGILARHYSLWFELHQPDWVADATTALGWYVSQLVVDVIREDLNTCEDPIAHLQRIREDILIPQLNQSHLLALVLRSPRSTSLYRFSTDDPVCSSPFVLGLVASLPDGIRFSDSDAKLLKGHAFGHLTHLIFLREHLPEPGGLAMEGFRERMLEQKHRWNRELELEGNELFEARAKRAADLCGDTELRDRFRRLVESTDEYERMATLDQFAALAECGSLSPTGVWNLVTDKAFLESHFHQLTYAELARFSHGLVRVAEHTESEWRLQLPYVLQQLAKPLADTDERMAVLAASVLAITAKTGNFAVLSDLSNNLSCPLAHAIRAIGGRLTEEQHSLPSWAQTRIRAIRATAWQNRILHLC